MADWAKLDHNLLTEIAERLPSMESYESFGGVCKSWQAAARQGHPKPTIFEGPWLMLAEKDENNSESREYEREFSSVSLGIKRTSKIFLPEVSKQRCVSWKDWLLVNSPDEIDVFLLHILSRVQIHLPKLSTLQMYNITGDGHFIQKAVLSANPATTSDFIVMIICGQYSHIGFWKSGDTCWTSMEYYPPVQFEDIMYCNNTLYGLDHHCNIVMCDIYGPNPTQLFPIFTNLEGKEYYRSYIVELHEGKFLIVGKCMDQPTYLNYFTTGFVVSEVNIEENTCVEVEDLGNKALFVGYNSSFSIECSEFNRCKRNCIYFSEDCQDLYTCPVNDDKVIGGGKDMGIYDLSDGKIRRLFDDIICSKITPPTWIGPSF